MNIIAQLKQSSCDYEYYPTTQEIVNTIVSYLYSHYRNRRDECCRVLDIGCGKGDFFDKVDNVLKEGDYRIRMNQRFGIEKSPVLIENLRDDVVLLGTDFNEQSLIDKEMDLIFCNPPYSEYENWAERIIREGNSPVIILVIPERWKSSELIKAALKKRNYKPETLGSFDFLDAERKARAKVDVIYLSENIEDRHGVSDAFDVWFDDTFKISAQKESESKYETEHSKESIISGELIQTENIAEQLVSLYQRDTEHLFSNYKALETLDYDLLKVLNVDIKNLKLSLKEKIKGLKHIYWEMLFNRYNEITERLTTYSKEKFLDKLHKNADIDFTMDNIYAVTLWIIKHSNSMYDEQLKDFYMKLADEESIRMYKSDKRFTDDDWRYLKTKVREFSYRWNEGKLKNFMYDYRVVYKKSYHNYEGWNNERLSENTFNFIWDVIHIAENFGFTFSKDVFYKDQWNTKADKELNLYYIDGKPFVNIKLYQNGNIHLKFDMEFMRRLNVESARLFGWITDRKEAAKEMGMSEADAARAWGCNAKLIAGSGATGIEFKGEKKRK